MNKVFTYLNMAGKIALSKKDFRSFFLGAVGIRNDGKVVQSINGATGNPVPKGHAEARLAKKLDYNAVVYVARVNKQGEFAMSRPCVNCMRALKAARVKKIYYSIGPNEFGVIDLNSEIEKVNDYGCSHE